jgi:hypothetical protein
MNRFTNKMVGLTTVAAVSVMLFGCAGGKSLKKDSGGADDAKSVYPSAIEKLIEGKYAQSLFAVGMGTHPDRNIALQRASIDADEKIAAQFQKQVDALQKEYTEAVNDQKLEETKNTAEIFTSIRLVGVTAVKEMASEGKDGFTAYVLKVISAEKLKNLVDERTNALTNFKAIQSYKELEDRVAKEKAAKE